MVEKLIAGHTGQRPERTGRKSRMILLTSGTAGSPKGAKQSGGGAGIGTLKATFPQLIFAAPMASTVVTRGSAGKVLRNELKDRVTG